MVRCAVTVENRLSDVRHIRIVACTSTGYSFTVRAYQGAVESLDSNTVYINPPCAQPNDLFGGAVAIPYLPWMNVEDINGSTVQPGGFDPPLKLYRRRPELLFKYGMVQVCCGCNAAASDYDGGERLWHCIGRFHPPPCLVC